jgi:predicted aldo/keto reductase-like oxidoreductase
MYHSPMQFKTDQKSGASLSILGFGGMRFPRNLGGIDMPKTERLILDAAAGGINYFDTAYIYPGSEEALGTILEKNGLREKVYLATKLPLVLCRGPGDFDRFFNKQLERLKTGFVDYYLLHMLTDLSSWERLRHWGIEGWIEEKKKAGKIRRLGFSFHGSRDEFLGLIDAYPWDFCQIQYNYSDEHYQAGVTGLKRAAARGIPCVIMEPLLGGKLANGLPREALALFKKARPDLSPAAWALRWLWDQAEPAVVLSGMNDPAQLRENLATAESARPGMLTAEERETFKRVIALFNRSYRIRCTACNYCMPCPRHVNIPACFAAYNTSYSMGFFQGMQQYTTSAAVISANPGGASRCAGCGRCESHCPQGIPIIRSLRQVRRRLEPPWYRLLIFLARKALALPSKLDPQIKT